jgi:molybdopterin synthase sulfur carrier subunit
MLGTMPAAVKMLVFAGARDIVGVGELEVPLPAPCSAGELLAEVCRRFPGLLPYGASLRMAVNGCYVTADNPVVAGDEVALIPPVAGG